MRKILFTLMLVAVLTCPVMGQSYRQKQIQFVNEWGLPVNMGTSVSLYIYDANTTNEQTCYLTREGATATLVTQPIEDDSANTPLDYTTGLLTFWSAKASYKIVVTDGTYSRTVNNLTSSDGRLYWPSILSEVSSTNYGQNNDIDFTHAGWIIDGDTAGRLDAIPDTDDSVMGIGSTSKTADLELFGGSSGKDLTWDASRDQLSFRDGAIAGFGGAALAAAADFTVYHTAGSGILTITAVSADEAVHFGDGSVATDVKFQNTVTATADVWWDNSGEIWHFGADNFGVDVKFWGDGTGNYAIWDESIDTLVHVDGNVKYDDEAIVYFGTGSGVTTADGDFTMNFTDATIGLLTVTATVAEDAFQIGDGSIATDFIVQNTTTATADIRWTDATETWSFGVTDFGVDVQFWGDAALNYMLWDESEDELYFEDAKIVINEGSSFIFQDSGDATDWTMAGATANRITFTPALTDDTATFHIGTADNTSDVVVFMKTSGETLTIDASEDSMTFVGDLALFTLTGTTKPFFVNSTGAVAGLAAEIQTTNGGITLDADGSDHGDIALESADDTTFTTAGDWTATVTGTTFIDGTGQAKLTSSSASADGVLITVDGGASSTMKFHADEGTAQDSIEFLTDGGGVTITATAIPDAQYGLEVSSAIAGTQNSDGAAIYAHTALTGSVTGPVANVGSWLDITGGTPTSACTGLFALDLGIYESGANLASMGGYGVAVLNMSTYLDGPNAPGANYMFIFNTDAGGTTPTALFAAKNYEAIAFTAGATTGATKTGAIAIQIVSTLHYIWTYDSAGP